MTDIDFSNIRSFSGSKHSGFEELVCQLAHLERPENAKKFVRKEGSGGDAGVECYWVLNDGREICWQAKYFLGEMNSSRWSQLDKSFQKALSKHQNLDTYVICLPLDKTDSRRTGKRGKQVTSLEDKWNEHEAKWKELANEQGCDVNIKFWGKHEIALLLTIDDPRYSGRCLYWFNDPVLRFSDLRDIAQKSRDTLGDRFTPEFHVDLPIVKQFDGLCANENWWSEISSHRAEFDKQYVRFSNCISDDKFEDSTPIDGTEFEDRCSKFIALLFGWIKPKCIDLDLTELKVLYRAVCDGYSQIYEIVEEKNFKDTDSSRNFQSTDADFRNQLEEIDASLESRNARAYSVGAALLDGEAGIGKSHLLCDIALNRLKNALPTLFLLGAQYGGGDPVDFIKKSLDLGQFRNKQVLGAIDSLGEAKRCKALIIIDAINEGPYRHQWSTFLKGFLTDISNFKNISLLISCRTTYLRYVLPDNVVGERLVRIHHQGFQGFEHRAAEKYLSQQGISKPSAPILTPEFSNPLFLKTCCKALKNSGENSFPKGLRGLTQIFNFYLGNVEKTISIKKQYNPSEKLARIALNKFTAKLFPGALSGIPTTEARQLINELDIAPHQEGGALFNLLLDEGVLSEDISYEDDESGHPIIRYTYERFSDVFVAQQLIGNHDSNTLKIIFDEAAPLGRYLRSSNLFEIVGILEALAIAIADKYHIELIDLMPDGIDIPNWQVDEIFINTVIWRSPDSFSDRTLEILNQIKANHLTQSPVLDILLKLATEPDHPWNACLLHRNLLDMEVSKRDHFWSIVIAMDDSSEEQGYESIVRTLIEWACFGKIDTAEDERIRLCAVTLFWFLTTSNRKVRDCATKSLVRILLERPRLIESLFNDFCDVNDLYLVERLYAVIYGVVCNTDDNDLIASVAQLVFEKLFKNGEPTPHILLRDYARGILELAQKKGILPTGIEPEHFRHPYRSPWPIENPSEEEINQIVGDEEYSDIKSSVMGFPGDFGNYTMSCVHRWSSTPLGDQHIKSGYQLKIEFANKFLEGELKDAYLSYIGPEKRDTIDLEAWIKLMEGEDDHRKILNDFARQEQEYGEALVKQIIDALDSDDQEYFRWLNGLANDHPAEFSRKWAQRWVCKRAYELGWKKELFAKFERNCSRGRGVGSSQKAMERVGKKYQWIAFHELLARLSDNVYWIDRGYSDLEESKYYGPWQVYKRNIDPTHWLRKNGEYRSFYNEQTTWWQPYRFPIENMEDLDDQKAYVFNQEELPDFSSLIITKVPEQSLDWYVLDGFWGQKQKELETDSGAPRLDCWSRINSILVSVDDFEEVKTNLSGVSLIDPSTVSTPENYMDGYLGEYPWHPVYDSQSNWQESNTSFGDIIPKRHFVPVSKYSWEKGDYDLSVEHTLSLFLPAKELVNELGLVRSSESFGNWKVGQDLVFIDPSIKEYGPSYALMREKELREWMTKKGLKIMWLISGGKRLFSINIGPVKFFGGLVYSGVYWLENDQLVGCLHFKKEMPVN